MISHWKNIWKAAGMFLGRLLLFSAAYLLIEVLAALILKPETLAPFAFAVCWAVGFAAISLLLPRMVGRIFFGITYSFFLLWTLAQTGYSQMFNRMMWLTDIFYAGEGAGYLGDVLGSFSWIWWIGGILLIGLDVVLIWKFPKSKFSMAGSLPYICAAALAVAMLILVPEMVFLRDLNVWGTRSEYAQSSSYRATYNTMYDAKNVYEICGVYQLTFRDVWVHTLSRVTWVTPREDT